MTYSKVLLSVLLTSSICISLIGCRSSTQHAPTPPVTALQVPQHLQQGENQTRNYYQTPQERLLANRDDLLIPPRSQFQTKK